MTKDLENGVAYLKHIRKLGIVDQANETFNSVGKISHKSRSSSPHRLSIVHAKK